MEMVTLGGAEARPGGRQRACLGEQWGYSLHLGPAVCYWHVRTYVRTMDAVARLLRPNGGEEAGNGRLAGPTSPHLEEPRAATTSHREI